MERKFYGKEIGDPKAVLDYYMCCKENRAEVRVRGSSLDMMMRRDLSKKGTAEETVTLEKLQPREDLGDPELHCSENSITNHSTS